MNYIKYYITGILLGVFICMNLQAQQTNPVNNSEILAITNQSELLTADNNITPGVDERIENYKNNDSFGIGIGITVLGVVFLGLVGLYLLFNIIGGWGVSSIRNRAMKIYGMSKEEAKGITKQSGEIYAAIAMAIYEATEMHDDENAILTIKNTVRNYSPWSSKIYSLREMPKR